MTPEFIKIISHVFDLEGGIGDDPDDRGGFTNMGITIPFLTTYLGRQATRDDIAGLTKRTAMDAYYKVIWLGYRMESYPSWARPVMFSSVCGSLVLYARMVRRIQALVGTAIDGAWGPNSMKAADAILATRTEEQLANGLALALGEEYMKISGNPEVPSQRKYAAGWYRRAYELSRLDVKEQNRTLHAALFYRLGRIATGKAPDENPLTVYRELSARFDVGAPARGR